MLRPEHPEVLAPDWTPPTLVARSAALEQLHRRLPVEPAAGGSFRAAIVEGPSGSGTSAVARRAALEVVERLRQRGEPTTCVYAPARVRWVSGTQGIATELLQRLDPNFSSRGFSVAQLVAGFLRRLIHSGRPAVVVLDDLGAGCPDISAVLRPLAAPDRFLPEGAPIAPRIWLVLSGNEGARACWRQADASGISPGLPVQLAPYTRDEIAEIVRDRARRALGRDAPSGWAERIADHAVQHGIGARRSIEMLRRELLGPTPSPPGSPYTARSESQSLAIEPRLLEAIERAAARGQVFVRDVREWEARLARAQGVRPLTSTTLWRRIVRLEAAGLLRREVRTGGSGGTRSRLELVRPVPAGSPFRAPGGTLPGADWSASPSRP